MGGSVKEAVSSDRGELKEQSKDRGTGKKYLLWNDPGQIIIPAKLPPYH
jgi:hypothetical protein